MVTFEETFAEPKVQELLVKCLNFGDLKACRGTCHFLHTMVMQHTAFTDKAVLVITKERLLGAEFFSRISWPSVSITLLDSQDPGVKNSLYNGKPVIFPNWLDDLLSEVLELNIASETQELAAHLFPSLSSVICRASNLRKLKIDFVTLAISFGDSVRPSETIAGHSDSQQILQQLEEFHLNTPINYTESEMGHLYPSFSFALKGIFKHATNLKAYIVEGKYVSRTFGDQIKPLLVTPLRTCALTLETLKFDDPDIWSFFKLSQNKIQKQVALLKFPNLKHVKIVIHMIEEEKAIANLESFLMGCELSSLELCVTHLMPNRILEAILASSKTLERLRIVTKGVAHYDAEMWTFLRILSKLEDFEVSLHRSHLYDDNFPEFDTIFKNLPKRVSKITLRGVGEYSGEEFLVEGLQVMQIQPMIITHLDVGSSGLLVDDETLQYVIKTFKMLRYLDVSNSVCTDQAFTGEEMGPEGKSNSGLKISDLKGLRTLRLGHCKYVTDVTCETVIEFKELRELDLSQMPMITQRGVLQVLNKNPSLEILFTDVELETSELLQSYSRLRNVFPGSALLQPVSPFSSKPLSKMEELSTSEESGDDSDINGDANVSFIAS